MQKQIHVHLFSLVPLTVEGIKSSLKSSNISIISETKSIQNVIQFLKGNFSCILIIDDSYLDKNELIFFLNKILLTCVGTKAIVYTRSYDPDYLRGLIANGTRGILHERAAKEKFFEAMELVNTGGVYFDNFVNSLIAEQTSFNNVQKENFTKLLSKRETEILNLIAQGLKNQRIAEKLFISQGTVEAHKNNILKKLKLRSSSELTIFAVRNKSPQFLGF